MKIAENCKKKQLNSIFLGSAAWPEALKYQHAFQVDSGCELDSLTTLQSSQTQGQPTMLPRFVPKFWVEPWSRSRGISQEAPHSYEKRQIYLLGKNADLNFQMTTDGNGNGDGVPATLQIWQAPGQSRTGTNAIVIRSITGLGTNGAWKICPARALKYSKPP